jgi:hypothetical protein
MKSVYGEKRRAAMRDGDPLSRVEEPTSPRKV